ncbi:unnamed protein product [Ilex paraguariensis]|uniref:Uncharacterized protein n=1 Tax=Ilex paraguariensis TaxID=185542 RepID=A0ABC8T720_9AQUA
MFEARVFGRTLVAVLKLEISTVAATSTATGRHPLEEFFEADGSTYEDNPENATQCNLSLTTELNKERIKRDGRYCSAVGTVAEIETLISRVNFVKQIGRFIMKSIHEWTSSFL